MEEIVCTACLNVFAKRRVEPNDAVFPIPVGLLFCAACIPAMTEVAMSLCVFICWCCILQCLLVIQMKVLKCAYIDGYR